jgi:nucleoside-diphosphate-sugar epimerase
MGSKHLAQLLQKCRISAIDTFINASSGSVYGVKVDDKVTEDLELIPISAYNKTKMVAERIVLSYQDYFRVVNVRPATVCGFSPRMRFDVVVNMFVLQAFQNQKIIVLGGSQVRPNIHIEDMISVYVHLINEGKQVKGDINAGFENLKIVDIAKLVAKHMECEIVIKESNDPRSYRQDSTKLINSGFSPKKGVREAIFEIHERLKSGTLKDDTLWHTVSTMKSLGLDQKV